MLKRAFDIVFSISALLIISPFFLAIAFVILLDSAGGVFYRQVRVGKNGKDFRILKFRTMHSGADKKGLLTVGMKDNRVTKVGYFLRKYKLDEIPQLLNVLEGSMSIVGPRPEVRKYVHLYNKDQQNVLNVKPGITDYASILYAEENKLLGGVPNPEEVYINTIMPEKLKLNLKYIQEQSFYTDIKIIILTIFRIIT